MIQQAVMGSFVEDSKDMFPRERRNLVVVIVCIRYTFNSNHYWCRIGKKMKMSAMFTLKIAWGLPCISRS